MDSEICPQSRQSSTDTRAGYTPTTRPGRSRSMLYYCYCALQSRAASWCYYLIYSIVSTILPATVASLLPIEAVPAVGILLCASSWPVAAAASAQATSDMTMGALEKRVSSALALIDISSTRLQENEAAAISAGAETELLTITKGYPWYAPVHFYLGLISQTRGELELAVEHYSAALRADSAHADATNNIASALSTLAPADRVRVTTSLGLMPSDTLQGKDTTKRNVTAGVGRKTLAAVDTVVEALFRRTLEAAEIFELALDLYPEDAELHFHLGVALQSAGNGQDAARSFMAALEFDPQNVGAALNLAALHHRYGKIRDAVDLYRNTVHMIDSDDDELMVMLRNNLGTALYQMGDHTLAKEEHRAVLALLGAQVKEKPTRGGANGERDVYIDTMVNMHRARKASCDWRDWENLLSDLKREVDMHQLGAERPPSLLPFDSLLLPYPIDAKWRRKIAEAHSRRYTKKTTDMPSGVEYDEHYRASVENRTYPGNAGVDIHPMRDGEAKSDDSTNRGRERGVYMGKGRAPTLDIGFLGHDFSEHPTAHMMEGAFVWQKRFSTTPVNNSQGGGRRSAFGGGRQWQRPPSVIEAVEKADEGEMTAFHSAGDVDITHSTLASCCRYSAYSYGGGGSSSDREDSSSNATNRSRTGTTSAVRESIQLLASSFVDLYPVGHAEASAKILGDGVNILLDLQGHTLGGRSEIAAARPAPIQASYLIFPGTSGAPYVDYLLADRHVIPPEHVNHYSESLVLLPWTYQTNFYEDRRWTAASEGVTATDATARMNNTERRALRRAHSLPEDLSFVVLANFNKVDKLGPESFYLWMQIMRRVPRAVLWLLEPSSMQRENEAICKRLGDEAEGYGVHRRRLMFAKRVPRTQHLSRHAAADLFLDTLTYGAHSTATDALAGGLPFLTLAGDAFASRVGVSLLRNAGHYQTLLLVNNQREYEDLAVQLLTTSSGEILLAALRTLLHRGQPNTRPAAGTPGAAAAGAISDRDVGTRHDRAREILPLFDTESRTLDLTRAYMLMWEVYSEGPLELGWEQGKGTGESREGRKRGLPHIVMTGRKSLREE